MQVAREIVSGRGCPHPGCLPRQRSDCRGRDGLYIQRGTVSRLLCADKLLLRIAVERERGVGQADLNEEQIAASLRDFGVSLIIVQPGFWEDLREMARFSAVLRSPEFERVAQFDGLAKKKIVGSSAIRPGFFAGLTARLLRTYTMFECGRPMLASPSAV